MYIVTCRTMIDYVPSLSKDVIMTISFTLYEATRSIFVEYFSIWLLEEGVTILQDVLLGENMHLTHLE